MKHSIQIQKYAAGLMKVPVPAVFAYNSDGYLDVLESHRDSANMARYWKSLDSPVNDAQEFWLEVDIVILSSSNSDLQSSLLGLFGNTSSNTISFVGTRFAYDNYLGSSRGQRFDMHGYDASGVNISAGNTVLDEPDGLPYDAAARVKMHYYMEEGKKKLCFAIYGIPSGQPLFMHADAKEILPEGLVTTFTSFGLGNRTDGGYLPQYQSFKLDNIYFSTEGPNANPVPPSFGYFIYPEDVNKDGKIDMMDLAILSQHWLDNCVPGDWCFGSDINTDGIVDCEDITDVGQNWLLRSEPVQLYLPNLFSDNMVLQRDSQVPVWGWSEPGQTITVTGSWNAIAVSSDVDVNGNWGVDLQTPPAGGPYQLQVSSGQKAIVFNNVMSGDVWVCSGQSNMAFTLDRVIDGTQEVADAVHPDIRLMAPIKLASDVPQENVGGNWVECSPESVPTFSAVGYYFCLTLQQNLNIPIGLIEITRGGYPIAPFMSQQALASDPDFATQLGSGYSFRIV